MNPIMLNLSALAALGEMDPHKRRRLAVSILAALSIAPEDLTTAGQAIGERVWRLPLWDEYGEEMRSDIADIKNLSDKPVAGAITAAKFLEAFTSDHDSWAHLDIAGTAFRTNGVTRTHTATAYGVRLLHDYVSNLS